MRACRRRSRNRRDAESPSAVGGHRYLAHCHRQSSVTTRIEDTVGPQQALTMSVVLLWHTTHRPEQPAFVFLERGEREAGP